MEVGVSQLPTEYPIHGTQENPPNTFQITPTGLSPSAVRLSRLLRLLWRSGGGTLQIHIPTMFPRRVRFALFPVGSPLLRESHLVPFPPPTKMFQFGGFPFRNRNTRRLLTAGGKSHSAIPGSTTTCIYPGLIAACHGLLRRPSLAIPQTA